jgi:hypothetical protein
MVSRPASHGTVIEDYVDMAARPQRCLSDEVKCSVLYIVVIFSVSRMREDKDKSETVPLCTPIYVMAKPKPGKQSPMVRRLTTFLGLGLGVL